MTPQDPTQQPTHQPAPQPTQADRFRNTIDALHQARLALSTARDWLNSTPRPLPAPAAAARTELLDMIGEAKDKIDAMKSEAYRALDALTEDR